MQVKKIEINFDSILRSFRLQIIFCILLFVLCVKLIFGAMDDYAECDVNSYLKALSVLKANYESSVHNYELKKSYSQYIDKQKVIYNARLDSLVKQDDVNSLIERLVTHGVHAGLEFKTIRPKQRKKDGFLEYIPLDLSFSSNYVSVIDYLVFLSEQSTVILIEDYKFKLQKKNPDIIDLSLKARVYYIND